MLVATFSDNGGTLNVVANDEIRVVLAGTSWNQHSSNSSVLDATTKPAVLPTSSGCVKNQGCGSVTVYYRAQKPGEADIIGDRSHCSSTDVKCQTGRGVFHLKVIVSKA